MKKVSVVIPCRNERDFIERCIYSIAASDYPEELLEIIVCDGLSEDGTREILNDLCSRIRGLKVITNEKKITPAARNLGVQHATGDYILIFDAHAEIAVNYISEVASILNEKPEVWCAGGVWENVYTNDLARSISFAMSSPFGVGSAHFRTGLSDGYVDTVGSPMYKKEVFERIGLFDEELPRNQDDEFNHRIQKSGGKIWLTRKTLARYYVRSSWKRLFSQYFQYGYWKVYVNRKHKTVTTTRQLVPPLFVMFLLTGPIFSLFSYSLFKFYLFIILLYVTIALGSAMKFSNSLKDILRIMISFFILHFSYGAGYAKGILDFVILRKKPHIS